MCILRYMPRNVPSASTTQAVLWYSPVARFSKPEATITTPSSAASLQWASVSSPGMGSARLKRSHSSVLQKYSVVKSSCVQMICAPWAAASRMAASVFSLFTEGRASADS